MTTLWWILGGGLAMTSIALVGSLTLVLREATLSRLLLPEVNKAHGLLPGLVHFGAFAAGLGLLFAIAWLAGGSAG